MRICPLCQATYEDDIEFCFKDGSPLDEVGGDDDGAAGSGDEEFSVHDSVEFMPPDAIALTGEIEVSDLGISEDGAEGSPEDLPPDDPDDDSGIKVVPGGLTSPLDDEDSIEAPDPFAMPAAADTPDVLAMVSGEFPARQPETLEAQAPELSDDDDDVPADTVEDTQDDELPPAPPEEPLDEPPESEPEEPPLAAPPSTDGDTSEADEPADSGTAWLDDVEDPAGPAAEAPAPEYTDPLYESIHTPDTARKKGIIWWVAIGVTAAAALAFLGYSLFTRGNRGGIEDTGQPTLTVDETPEERPTAPPPIDRDTPTPGDGMVDEDATEGMDEDATDTSDREGMDEDVTGGVEEPTPPEESPTEEPPTEPATPEPPTPEPVTPEPVTPEPPTPAPPATGDNPWLVAANNPTTDQPADPSNPWAAAANAAQSGKMTVSSTPVGATFFVDGTRKGTTPLTVDVPYGHHNVRVEKDGHVGQERPVSVQSGTVFVDFTLEKTAAPAAGKLTVFTNPQPGATLFVDGAARGKTPVTLDITPGVHTLRVELAGFPTKEETIDLSDLQPGENRRRVISME